MIIHANGYSVFIQNPPLLVDCEFIHGFYVYVIQENAAMNFEDFMDLENILPVDFTVYSSNQDIFTKAEEMDKSSPGGDQRNSSGPAASITQSVSSPFSHSSSSDEGESAEIPAEHSGNQLRSPSVASGELSIPRSQSVKPDPTSGATKICRVCGDKALGYNFNVISCESCKAFFRRNALKKKEFVCPFNNNCDVTYVSRRFCQKCRLKKCFDVGMNPDWIMSEDALAAKRRRRVESCNSSVERALKSPVEMRRLTPSATAFTSSIEPILLAANSTDALTVLANCASPTPPPQQQQFALLTPQGGGMPKVITLVPFQQVQQSTATNVLHSNSAAAISTHSGTVKTEDDTINIPKDILINLITKCHSNDANGSKSLNSGQLSTAKRHQCVCKCLCGAKSNCDPIGVEKSDKMVSTEDLSYHDRPYYQHGHGSSLVSSASVPALSASAPTLGKVSSASPLDFSVSAATTRGCRALAQQQMAPSIQQQQPIMTSRECQQQTLYGDMLDAAIVSLFNDGNLNGNFGASSMQSGTSSSMGYSNCRYRQLDPIEQQRLDELMAANEVMKEPLEGTNEQRIYEGHNVDPKLMDVINMTDIAVRRIIKMNKRIEAFRNLCQEDQIALLKGGCTELMILRGIMTYDPEKDSWLTRVHNTGHEYIKLEVLKGVRGNVYEQHKKYVQSFPAAWRNSEPIMLILGAITLFNPNRANIVHKDLIKLERQFYYELLKNYLTTIYEANEAEETYAGLVDRLDTLHQVNEFAASIFLDINPRDVEPLLIEIFDLKK